MKKNMYELFKNGSLEEFMASFVPYVKYYAKKIYSENKILFKEEDLDDLIQIGCEYALLIYKKYPTDKFNVFNQLFFKQYYVNSIRKYGRRKKIVELFYQYLSSNKKCPTYEEFINYLKQCGITLRSQDVKNYIESAHLKFAFCDSEVNYEDGIINKIYYGELFEVLNDKEKGIVTARTLQNRTLEDIKKDYGLSRERIRQINEKGISKLKERMKAR